MANASFRIQAQLAMPNFEGERRYIMLEKELALKQCEAARKRAWLWFRVSSLNIYTEREWQAYLRLLDKYSADLAQHQREIHEGLVPIHLKADNNSSVGLIDVRIHLEAENGNFKPKKKPPQRPRRMDGAPDKMQRHNFRLPGGFVRKHLRIGNKSLDVTFNRLAPYDSALICHQVLYVDSNSKTRLVYKVSAQGHDDAASGSLRIPVSH